MLQETPMIKCALYINQSDGNSDILAIWSRPGI